MKKIRIFLVVCLVLHLLAPAGAENRVISLGGKNGWPEMSKMNNISQGEGRFAHTCLELSTNSPEVTSSTDMLLHFEDARMIDATGNYTISENNLALTPRAIHGKGAALSSGTDAGMVLHGCNKSIFGSSGYVGSFSIEFWLSPSVASSGETVLSWHSSRNVGGHPVYQSIAVLFVNNKLEWNFSNVFEGYSENGGEVAIQGSSNVIPDKWAFHKLSFDESSGLLEYRINGTIEALKYMTSSGHERGFVHLPVLGVPANIELCPRYTGRIDDMCIMHCAGAAPSPADMGERLNIDRYDVRGGRFETEPLMTKPGSVLNSVTAVTDIPPQTDVRLYVRSGNNYYGWTDASPQWIPVTAGEQLNNITGLYFQVAVELFPDGAGQVSPSITELSLHYTEYPAPLPPFFVTAKAGDKTATISWSPSVDESAGGYYVYYGEHPGEYLGRASNEGASPVNVGSATSATFTGLKAGTIYYFAVSSWSKYDDSVIGELSQEVYARPYGDK